MTTSFTIDGTDLTGAPLSEMTQATADAIAAAANDFRDVAMHLHADIADYDVTLTAANAQPGELGVSFDDGSFEVTTRVAMGDTPTFTHTYLTDGVYTATLRHENGDRAFLELVIPTAPEEVLP